MKKFLAALSAISFILFSACSNQESSETSVIRETVAVNESSEESSESQSNQTLSGNLQQCTVGSVTFSVPAEWTAINGFDGAFTASSGKSAYTLQGESSLGSYTPEEFYKSLINYYSEEHEILSSDNRLSSFTTSDNIDAQVGRIEMKKDSVFFITDILIVPQKNKVLTFGSQAADKNNFDMDIREITKTAKIDIGSKDYISGNTFVVSDNSKLCFNRDNTFKYYQSKDSGSTYCEGDYEVFYGQQAIDKIISMPEYGLTNEELEPVIKNNMNGYKIGGTTVMDFISEEGLSDDELYHVCKDTFYAVILHNKTLIDNGSESPMGNDTLYIGYYISELNYVDMINAATASRVGWTMQ